jgi:hypothetical protein
MATTYITPTSGNRTLPDIVGGQLTQTPGNPPLPGTQFAGPVLAGNNKESDGSGNLSGVGEDGNGMANSGYAVMTQQCAVTQATNDGTAGQFACPMVIPAQSSILRMTLRVTTAWSGASADLTVGNETTATAYTPSNAVTGAGTLGDLSITAGANATQLANWLNTGTQDHQIVLLSANTGNGVGILTVEYIQSNDMSVTP